MSVANYVSVFGFLAGSVAASASVYYYVLAEYKIANEMLSDDISVCLQLLTFCHLDGTPYSTPLLWFFQS
jgi:hypothetical protein